MYGESEVSDLFDHQKTKVEDNRPLTLMFAEMQYEDWCDDARFRDVIRYLRGSKGLSIPPEWRPLIPDYI